MWLHMYSVAVTPVIAVLATGVFSVLLLVLISVMKQFKKLTIMQPGTSAWYCESYP